MRAVYNDHDRARLLGPDIDATGAVVGVRATTEEDLKRPTFGRDYDRIVHTNAFRRLQGKTQVVTPGQADFFRTRLTHTVEVAQIARRLAWRLCESEGSDRALEVSDVCEAAATMHDLGHPPFGHVGEVALNDELDVLASEWDVDKFELGGFEGNAQSFRQVVTTVSRAAHPGLQLTRATLDASIKYPRTRSHEDQRKWNYYPSERWAYEWVREGVSDAAEKSFEAMIMEWADDVAYATHDIDDWFRAGYMPLPLLAQSAEAREQLAGAVIEAWSARQRSFDDDAVRGAITDLFLGPAFGAFADVQAE